MSKTVLLVDYDPRSIDRIRAALNGIGVSMVLATDGWSAEVEFQRTLPDVTLVQDIIPKKTGYQLCRDLKSTATGSAPPGAPAGPSAQRQPPPGLELRVRRVDREALRRAHPHRRRQEASRRSLIRLNIGG
jgi:CheY-like chemotaxis protein